MTTRGHSGSLRKMRAVLSDPVDYFLVLDKTEVPLNEILGCNIKLEFHGLIHCIYCGRKTSKSFNQGYCFPCFRKLAQCDLCIVSPEKCHYHEGTCREPTWGQENCMTKHIVYLSITSGLKVGITRSTQVPTRWIDQGATQAQPIFIVSTRYQSGIIENIFSKHVADKTNWRAMLKGNQSPRDLQEERAVLVEDCKLEIEAVAEKHGKDAIRMVDSPEDTLINYPVLEFPTKVSSHNFEKNPIVSGRLMGIKGQYLLLDSGVINLRKFGGYEITFSVLQ